MLKKEKKNQKGCTRSWFNCCVWVAAQLEAPRPILEGKQSRRRYRQHPDLPTNIPAFLAVVGRRGDGEGAEVGGAKLKPNQTNFIFPASLHLGCFVFPPTPHTHTHTCIFDLIMPLFVAVMKTGIRGGGMGCSTPSLRSSLRQDWLSLISSCPPSPLLRLRDFVFVFMWHCGHTPLTPAS